jgi:hypothetical protein
MEIRRIEQLLALSLIHEGQKIFPEMVKILCLGL